MIVLTISTNTIKMETQSKSVKDMKAVKALEENTLVKYINDIITIIKDKNQKIIEQERIIKEQERIINGYRSANAALKRQLTYTGKKLE